MAIEVERPPRPASLERVLAAHREEAERLREELGDPAEALASFVREQYDPAALEDVARDMREGASFWHDDDVAWDAWSTR
ncbi:MAG: hypothetical protein ACRDJW_26135 [Thermomicrobiales bacterium]